MQVVTGSPDCLTKEALIIHRARFAGAARVILGFCAPRSGPLPIYRIVIARPRGKQWYVEKPAHDPPDCRHGDHVERQYQADVLRLLAPNLDMH